MPYSDEREDCQFIQHAAGLTPESRRNASAHGDKEVAQAPLVEAAVPAAPEVRNAVVIAHAADHVLWWIDAVEEGPETEEAPGDEQLEPYVLEVEEAKHAELGGRVGGPWGPRVENGHHVHVVDHYFHGE